MKKIIIIAIAAILILLGIIMGTYKILTMPVSKQIEEKEDTIEFTFENKKIEVPKTGDNSNMKLFAGLGLLSLLGITCILIQNHKKNKEE